MSDVGTAGRPANEWEAGAIDQSPHPRGGGPDGDGRSRGDRSACPASRATSSVIGVLLLAAIAVLLSVSVGVVALDVGNVVPDSTGSMYVEVDRSPVGYTVIPQVLDGPVAVVVNGQRVATIGPDATHEPFPLPVAPGDRVVLTTDVGRQDLSGRAWTAAPGTGPFVAYYTFEAGSGSTVSDRSGRSNDATVHGASWIADGDETALAFDGDADNATVDRLPSDGATDLDEFTVALGVRVDADTGEAQRIAEVRNGSTQGHVRLSTDGEAFPMQVAYSIRSDAGAKAKVKAGSVDRGEEVVVVATYDGSEMRLYLDGALVGSSPMSGAVSPGKFVLGADAKNPDGKSLDGRLSQVRLYHASFDPAEVEVLADLMRVEAE